jgi:membrane protein YqaA with SNARE-associated domain
MEAYAALAAGAFLAATLLPMSSEAMLAALVAGGHDPAALFAVAVVANTAGSCVNWSLLFAWLPLIGDPLTVAAGVLRTGFLRFVVLTGLGKAARYAAVMWLAREVAGT